MSIEIFKPGEQKKVIPDRTLLAINYLGRLLGVDRRTIRTASLRAGVLGRDPDHPYIRVTQVEFVPVIVAELGKSKSPESERFRVDTTSDFTLEVSSGAKIVYQYPKK